MQQAALARSDTATPHVGQGTEDNCAGVRSRILMDIECPKKWRNSVQFGTVLAISPRKLSIPSTGRREQSSRTPARLTLGALQLAKPVAEPTEDCFHCLCCDGLSSGAGSGLGKWARVRRCCECGMRTT